MNQSVMGDHWSGRHRPKRVAPAITGLPNCELAAIAPAPLGGRTGREIARLIDELYKR